MLTYPDDMSIDVTSHWYDDVAFSVLMAWHEDATDILMRLCISPSYVT